MTTVTHIIRRRRNRRASRREVTSRRRVWSWLVGLFALVLLGLPSAVVLGSTLLTYSGIASTLPAPRDTIYLDPMLRPTEIYDASGSALLFAVADPLGDDRDWVALDDLPEYVIQATLLWEDPDFLRRARFDPARLMTRLWDNWLNGPVAAESSLAGRLVRNVLAPPADPPTVEDREREAVLVAEINRRYTPREILEWHLNTNYYGNEAFGIDAAARIYLGKPARDLTLDEAALLAAIPTAPQFNPVDNETAARGRQADMLRRMLAASLITQSQFEAVINVNTPILVSTGPVPLLATDFALYARRQAEAILDRQGRDGARLVSRGGLRITTTLDLDLYLQADCTLRAHLARLGGDLDPDISALDGSDCAAVAYLPPVQAASAPPDTGKLLILDVASGEIRAMIGPAWQASHQPGPTLHPFVYLHGFMNASPNYTPATMLLDIPRQFPGAADGLIYLPNNPDDSFRGPLSLRDAMATGLLPPVTQVANVLNLNNVLRRTAHPLGINSLRSGVYDLSLLQRGGGVSLLDVSYAYSVFATLGQVRGRPVEPLAPGLRNHDPVAVRRIEDASGQVLWDYDEFRQRQGGVPLLQAELAYIVNDVLADPAPRRQLLGQNNILEMTRRAAVVNGMTGDKRENWTVGYTSQLVTGVHLQRADSVEMGLSPFAIEGAAHVWRAVMEYAQQRDGTPPDWERPASVVEAPVCETSGMSPNGACRTRSELFISSGQIPPEDTYWELVEVNTQTNQRATVSTPAALRLTRAYFVPPADALDWWVANNRPLPPQDFDTVSRMDILSSAAILQPTNLDIVGGVVDVRGTIDVNNMDYYQLAFGQGMNPNEWIDITGQRATFTPGTSLGEWNTAGLDGTYVLRLSVARTDGTLETSVVQVIVDNIPPSVVLRAGEPGQVFRWPDDSAIPLVAEVTDNIRVDRVEFYHNGQFVDTDTGYPFGYEHPINRTGIEIFTAVVFDAVGNSSQAELQVEVRRSGD